MIDNYRRRPRIVYTMTTIPSRLEGMLNTCTQVMSKLKYCDKFYLNIPSISCRGKAYNYTESMLDRFPPEHRKKIEVNRCKDVGPITKILPTLYKETHPETLIVSMDDDILLKQDVSQILLEKHYEYPDACLSFSGFCIGTFPISLYQFALTNKKDLECSWLQGVHTQLFPRGLICADKLSMWKPHMFKHDDHRIASFLASEDVRKISINRNPVDYMANNMELAGTESISGSSEFIFQNAKICYKFKKEGYYHESHASLWLTSITGLLFLTVGLAAITVWANSFFMNKDIYFIGIYSVVLLTILGLTLTSAFVT